MLSNSLHCCQAGEPLAQAEWGQTHPTLGVSQGTLHAALPVPTEAAAWAVQGMHGPGTSAENMLHYSAPAASHHTPPTLPITHLQGHQGCSVITGPMLAQAWQGRSSALGSTEQGRTSSLLPAQQQPVVEHNFLNTTTAHAQQSRQYAIALQLERQRINLQSQAQALAEKERRLAEKERRLTEQEQRLEQREQALDAGQQAIIERQDYINSYCVQIKGQWHALNAIRCSLMPDQRRFISQILRQEGCRIGVPLLNTLDDSMSTASLGLDAPQVLPGDTSRQAGTDAALQAAANMTPFDMALPLEGATHASASRTRTASTHASASRLRTASKAFWGI